MPPTSSQRDPKHKLTDSATKLYAQPKYWAECFGTAPYLPMCREEMDALGWDSCDIIIVTADAYVDHPSFGMAVVGRVLEAQGYRVGIISQPNWSSAEAFKQLGQPNLFFGVTAGNMDSLINRFTADLRKRSDDAYTPGGIAGKRPDRSVIVYSQRCREAYYDTPIVIGGIEASLRRIAQYDYWSDAVRRSILIDSNANILLYGNSERALIELAHRVAAGEPIEDLWQLRGSAIVKKELPAHWTEIDSTRIDWPAKIDQIPNPYDFHKTPATQQQESSTGVTKPLASTIRIIPLPLQRSAEFDPQTSYIRLPSFNKVTNDPALYAHASRILHQEANPYNAKTLVQKHGTQEVWVNPPQFLWQPMRWTGCSIYLINADHIPVTAMPGFQLTT
jgi:uncharacterized radical SAM protein YgiQ